jgi:drug/metabolite transporter (DMT)-like permease
LTAPGRWALRALVFTVAGTLFWPMQEYTGGLLIRDHHPAQVVWLRYAAHLLLLVALVLPLQGLSGFSTRRPGLQLLRGLCMFGMPAGFIVAAGLAPVPWIWVVFWTMPGLALLGGMVLGERPSPAAWVASALAVIAATAIFRPPAGNLLGTAAALVMGGSFAAYVVLSRVLRHEKLGSSLLYTAVGAVAPMSLLVWMVWTPMVLSALVPALLTGALSLLILGAFDLALEVSEVAFVAPLIPLVLMWEVGMASVRHGSAPSAGDALGVILVLSGVGAALLVGLRRGSPDGAVRQSAPGSAPRGPAGGATAGAAPAGAGPADAAESPARGGGSA